jgi:general secretion pathway protein B
MSYILNALKKSEHQRQANQAESLERQIMLQPQEEQKKVPYWLIILVLVNACFLAYFIWSLLIQNNSPELQTKTPLKETAKHISIDNPVHISNLKQTEKKQQESISALIKKQKQNAVNQSIIKQKTNKPNTSKTKSLIKSVKKQANKLITKNITLPKPAAIAVIEKPEVKENKENIVKNSTNDVPFLSELASNFRRKVPSVDVNVFVYSENKAERFIMLDMQKYKSGEDIKDGLMLKEIRRNSLLVEYDGRVFQIKRN